jgi:signal transduction histidine kinase
MGVNLVLWKTSKPGAEPLAQLKGDRPDTSPASPPAWPRRLPFLNLSIKQRLPLLIGILLSGMLGAAGWAAYHGVKESALEASQERLHFLTQQLANLFQQSFNNMVTKTAAAAKDPVLSAFLLAPTNRSPAELSKLLQPFLAPQDASSLHLELWNAQRALVSTWPENAVRMADLEPEFQQAAAAPSFSAVGTMRLINGTIAYPIVAAVKDTTEQPLGFLVRWRKVAATAEARQQFVDLLGTQANFYLGNQQGDVWTDLVKVSPKPPVEMAAVSAITEYMRAGEHTVMALARPVNGTPWYLLVEFSKEPILIQARRFLRRLALVGLLLLAVGLGFAVMLSHSITRPLAALTKAAVALSEGNDARLVSLHSQDELGVLAQTFDAMAVKVRDSHRELEAKVQDRTLQLQTINHELEAFSYSVSHDLRAPLRHINGFSQALLEDYADQLDEVGKQYLQEVRGASKEMAQLIDDLLQLARVTRSKLRREPVNLSELAQEVVLDLQKSMVERTVTVKLEEGLLVYGDRGLLRVVLSNLLGNAWKFTAKCTQAEIVFGQEWENEAPVYFVRDNGAGFEMAYASKLFGAFQRLHSAGEFEGTGIGLATVQRVIHRHEGRVWATGAVNQGATFYFTLPSSPGRQTEA